MTVRTWSYQFLRNRQLLPPLKWMGFSGNMRRVCVSWHVSSVYDDTIPLPVDFVQFVGATTRMTVSLFFFIDVYQPSPSPIDSFDVEEGLVVASSSISDFWCSDDGDIGVSDDGGGDEAGFGGDDDGAPLLSQLSGRKQQQAGSSVNRWEECSQSLFLHPLSWLTASFPGVGGLELRRDEHWWQAILSEDVSKDRKMFQPFCS